MKILKVVMVLFCSIFVNLIVGKASGDGFISVASEEALKECLNTQSACKLETDISVSSANLITGNVILDLSGHEITPDPSLNLSSGFILVDRGGKLTIHDSVGTGKISTGPSGKVWAAIQLAQNNGKEGIAELEVNAGTVEGYYYGIVGNGNVHNTKVTINGGNIGGLNSDDSVGIYQPQIGEIIINGGTITGGTGIEIRSGTLTINNGTVKGISPTFNRVVNRSGSTTNGAGVTIAQHTTKNPITVKINDGNFSGQYAFYEWNPHSNSSSDLNKININISGGNFTTNVEDGYAVYSEDFRNFISGGKFNSEVREYLTDDANVITTMAEDLSIKKNNYTVIYILIGSLIILSCISIVLYKKGIILKNI